MGQYMGQQPLYGNTGAIHGATASVMVTLGQYMGQQLVYGNTGAIHGAAANVW